MFGDHDGDNFIIIKDIYNHVRTYTYMNQNTKMNLIYNWRSIKQRHYKLCYLLKINYMYFCILF
jgi:hypothetical protein